MSNSVTLEIVENPTVVLVRNLPSTMTSSSLMLQVFPNDGDIVEVNVHVDNFGKCIGSAEVTFLYKEEAQLVVHNKAGLMINKQAIQLTILGQVEKNNGNIVSLMKKTTNKKRISKTILDKLNIYKKNMKKKKNLIKVKYPVKKTIIIIYNEIKF